MVSLWLVFKHYSSRLLMNVKSIDCDPTLLPKARHARYFSDESDYRHFAVCSLSIPTSRGRSSLPETYDRVLSTLQSFFISHQIYVSLVTRSGNTALLDQILLYVLSLLS